MTTALLLVAHGSRHADANADLHHLARGLEQRGHGVVVASFLELAEPDIVEGGCLCVRRGAREVVLVPYFLSAGVHVCRDLAAARDRLARRFPGVEFRLAEPLSGHPLLLDVVCDRVREALSVTPCPPGNATPDPVGDLFDLLRREGDSSYHGEQVTQLEHALQAALAAEQTGAAPALITAALLHDVGHLLTPDTTLAVARGEDLGHEAVGADYLAGWFPEEVTEPIRLHVPAKRYLCLADPGYQAGLSAASGASLRVQGGPMTEDEGRRFRAHPHFEAALALRRWDEAAKVPGLATPGLEHFRRHVQAVLRW